MSAELFTSVKSLLGTRRKLAALQVFLQQRTFTSDDYKLLDRRLQRFDSVARARRINVYTIGVKQRIAVVRLTTGPQFYIEQFLLADQYVADVLSDLLRSALNIAAHDATGSARVEFATPKMREEIARIDLSAIRETLPSFSLSMVAPERSRLEGNRRWPDLFGELRLLSADRMLDSRLSFFRPAPRKITVRTGDVLSVAKPEQPRLVDIFYAKDRMRTGRTDAVDFYGYGQSEELALGICHVSIPPRSRHTIGRIEEPKIWKLEFRSDPAKHVVVQSLEEVAESDFYGRMRAVIADHPRKQAFIFVHGYNVTFADAAKRTAQIHADLEFAGAPILYSWPSRGTLKGYAYDSERVKATRKRFGDFVLDVWNRTGANEIHVVAHSMGNRVVAAALESINLDAAINPKPPFNQIVLAAPDLDIDDFSIAISRMQGLGKRLTLYASSRDKAIRASKKFLFKLRRAGEGGRNLVVLNGLDSIDASLVDTDFLAHSYIADSGRLLGDLHALVNGNSPPPRFGIAARTGGGWMFLKQA